MVAIELAYINTKHPDFHRDAAVAAYKLENSEYNKGTSAISTVPQNFFSQDFEKGQTHKVRVKVY